MSRGRGQRTAAASAPPGLSARGARRPNRSPGSPLFSHSARPPGPRAGAARTSDPHGHSPQRRRLESLQTTTILQGPPPRSRSEPPRGHPATPPAHTAPPRWERWARAAAPPFASQSDLQGRRLGPRAAKEIKTTPRPPPSPASSAPHNRQPRASGSRGRREHAEGAGGRGAP